MTSRPSRCTQPLAYQGPIVCMTGRAPMVATVGVSCRPGGRVWPGPHLPHATRPPARDCAGRLHPPPQGLVSGLLLLRLPEPRTPPGLDCVSPPRGPKNPLGPEVGGLYCRARRVGSYGPDSRREHEQILLARCLAA